MKLKILIISLVAQVTISCSDFLDHPLTGSVSSEDMGKLIAKDPSQFEGFLADAYRTLGSIHLYGRQLEISLSTMSHELDIDYIADESRNQFMRNNMTSSNTYIELYYIHYYSVLQKINEPLDLLEKIDVESLDEKTRLQVNNYKGEFLFLRAYVHFDLLRIFGEKGPNFGGGYPNNKDAQGVILAQGLVTAENALSPRATVEKTYAVILEDLKAADALIGNNQIPANTKNMAAGVKDDDYTLDFGWAQKPAVAALLGKVYLYMNQPDLAKIAFERVISDSRFKLDKPVNFTDYIQHRDNSAESIFALQYYYYTGPATAYTNGPMHQINRIYTNVPEAWANYFIDSRTFARFGNDPRLYEATLYDKTWRRWSSTVAGPTWTDVDVNAPTFRCYPRKFINFYDTKEPRDGTKNVELIRLADVYLMYAEVMLEMGQTATATEYVNKLRRRAWNETNYDSPGTKSEDLSTVTLKTIQDERYKELFFENHRWFDLCRWGILEDELKLYPTTLGGTVEYNDNDYYMPIPAKEFKTNPPLKQSRGY